MKVLVGTLYSGENEFSECKESLEKQTHKGFEHLIIENLPKKEAHHKLFSTFMEKKNEFDLFIKLDADMVIEDPKFIERICQKFQENKNLKFFLITVHDFFVNEAIWGLHCYRNNVSWQLGEEKLFTDANDIAKEFKEKDNVEFANAISHCKNPSPFQCFHFGIHRGHKVIQAGRTEKKVSASFSHLESFAKIWKNYQQSKNIHLAYAILGAELVFSGEITTEHINYTNQEIKSIFEHYKKLNEKLLLKKISSSRLRNFSFLPLKMRQKLLMKRFN